MCILCEAQEKRDGRVQAIKDKITATLADGNALMIGDTESSDEFAQTLALMASGSGLTKREVMGLWNRSSAMCHTAVESMLEGVPPTVVMEGLAFESMLFGMVLRDLVIKREQEGGEGA